MKKLFTYKSVLFAIFVIACILRFWQLGQIPQGFHSDEVSYGYNAYSILKTGRDEYGKVFPLIIQSFNDYKGAIYAYVSIPFIHIFGLNEWSVRAPSALFGILFVVLTYVFVYQISKNKILALIAMGLATLSPVGILLSRVQSDPLMSICFLYLAITSWFIWVEKKQIRYLVLLIFSVFLSFFTNTITRLFIIPFFLLIGYQYFRQYDRKTRIVFVGIVCFVLLFVSVLFVSPAGSRFSQISVFTKMDVQLPLEEAIREDGMLRVPIFIARVFHNKITAYSNFFLKNFTDYLSMEFLFLQAKEPAREQIPNMGVLLLVELPFLLIGIYTAIKKKIRYGIFSILWLLLVPAVLSIAIDETPNIHRFFLATLPIHILVALGITTGYSYMKRKCKNVYIITIILLFSINSIYFFHQMFIHQPIHAPIFRNSEQKELVQSLKEVYPYYDVIVSQKVLEYILFYWQVDPTVYQKQGSPRDYDDSWYDKFLFVTDACPSARINPKVKELVAEKILYVDKAECPITSNDSIVKVITYSNTLDAYRLVEKKLLFEK